MVRLMVAMALVVAVCVSAGADVMARDPSALCPPTLPGGKADAVLNEAIWQIPPVVSKFADSRGQAPKEQTGAWVAYGQDGVWFAFACDQVKLSPKNSPTSKEIWTDDAVGVIIDTAGERRTLDCYGVNAAGAKVHVRLDRQGKVNWNAGGEWQSAVRVEPGKWYAEFLVPYSVLGVTLREHSVLRANLTRNNAAIGEITSWAPVNTMPPQPLRLGNLVMGIPSAFVEMSADTKRGGDSAAFRVHCESRAKSDLKLTATLFPGGKTLEAEKPAIVPAGQTADAVFVAEPSPGGLVNLRVVATDAASGAAVSEASFTGESKATEDVGIGAKLTVQPWGIVWSSIATSKVMRDTLPPRAKASAIQISAARNEYEAFQIVLRPTNRLFGVKVIPHTLVGPKGSKIAAWNIKARNVDYVNVTEPTSEDVQSGWYPDPLPEFTPFTAEAGQNSPVWVTVYVPPKTPAGLYTGAVDILATGVGKVSVPIKLRVWDFDLPTVSRLRTAYGCDMGGPCTYQSATTLEQKRKLLDLYNLDFFRHRMAPYSPYTFYEVKGAVENGQVKLDFTDFDEAVRKYLPLFNSFNLPGFGMGNTAGMSFGDEYERLKIEYMRAVTEHLVDLGQIEKGYNYITDEPTEEQYPSVVAAADLCRKADQRIKVLLTEQVEKPLIGSVDIWVPVMPNYDEEKSKARQTAGEEVWWYVCCWPHHPYPNNFIDYAALDHRIQSWITWRYGVNGVLYWQATYWRDNPYETAMSYTPDGSGKWGNGDGRLLYPPVRTPASEFVAKGPVPSIRWEMLRDGVEDYDYFRILEDRLAKAKPGPTVERARVALDRVRDCAKSRTEFTRDPRVLESVRRRVAEAIEGLR